jgi:hypothetical protein
MDFAFFYIVTGGQSRLRDDLRGEQNSLPTNSHQENINFMVL